MEIKIPLAFRPLFSPMRYKVYYGGRGAAKSWAYAIALLVQGMQKPLRILCARELQISIADSVHKLLADQIRNNPRFEAFYSIQQATIKGQNGTEFLFKGLKHNSTEIKSTEGIDVAWVEEAEKVSDNSWELLIPTIRKDGSEIWISVNNKQRSGATYRLFVANKRDDAHVQKVSWRDNEFFPAVLKKEMEHLRSTDYEAYLHIWEGEFDTRFFGGIYSKQILRAEESGRVVDDIYDVNLPVGTAWDLGYSDSTSIVFWQVAGKEMRIIDYYENCGMDIPHYVGVLKGRGYRYDRHIVPHDAKHRLLASGGKSIVEQAYKLGVKMIAMPPYSQQNQIEATRAMLGDCWFGRKRAGKLLDALRQYQFEYDEDKKTFKPTPLHDWSSHAADATETLAQFRISGTIIPSADRPKFWTEMTAKDLFWPEKQPDKYERF